MNTKRVYIPAFIDAGKSDWSDNLRFRADIIKLQRLLTAEGFSVLSFDSVGLPQREPSFEEFVSFSDIVVGLLSGPSLGFSETVRSSLVKFQKSAVLFVFKADFGGTVPDWARPKDNNEFLCFPVDKLDQIPIVLYDMFVSNEKHLTS